MTRRASESGFEIAPRLRPLGTSRRGSTERLGEPGEYPYTRGVYASMYTGRPWTMRQYAGFGTAKESNERYHHLVAAGHRRAVGRLRPADPDGLRLRRPGGLRRGRQGRRRDRLARGHADAVRRHPARTRSRTSMTINAPAAVLLLLYQLVAEEQGVAGRPDHRHDPERRAQGVHRPRHLHLPAGPLAPADHRHLRLLQDRAPALEHHLDLRLPHGRGRGDARAGDRLHPRRRHRVRAGRRRARASTSTTSPRGWRSSSSPARRCSRRSRSSAPPAGSGRSVMRERVRRARTPSR